MWNWEDQTFERKEEKRREKKRKKKKAYSIEAQINNIN